VGKKKNRERDRWNLSGGPTYKGGGGKHFERVVYAPERGRGGCFQGDGGGTTNGPKKTLNFQLGETTVGGPSRGSFPQGKERGH